MQNMVWSYCKKISPEWKLQVSIVSLQWVSCVLCLSFSSLSAHLVEQMEQKMTASDIFKDKKDNYPQSVPKLFVSTRLSKTDFFPPPTASNHCYTCTSFTFHTEGLEQHISSWSDGEDINPKVLQALGNEKMKVSRDTLHKSEQKRLSVGVRIRCF